MRVIDPYLKDVVLYLTVFIFGMQSFSSLLVLYGLTDAFFWKKLGNCFGKLPLLKITQALNFENLPCHPVLKFSVSCMAD